MATACFVCGRTRRINQNHMHNTHSMQSWNSFRETLLLSVATNNKQSCSHTQHIRYRRYTLYYSIGDSGCLDLVRRHHIWINIENNGLEWSRAFAKCLVTLDNFLDFQCPIHKCTMWLDAGCVTLGVATALVPLLSDGHLRMNIRYMKIRTVYIDRQT